MLLIHGAGGNSNTWKYQIEHFKHSHQMVIVDLRDHGQSQGIVPLYKKYTFDIIVSDIMKVLDELGVVSISVMSLSMGSMIAQKLALLRPGLVNQLIFAGGVFHVTWPIVFFAHSAWFLTRFLPYRWMYHLFSWIVMPRKNHQFSRKIFIKQSALLSSDAYDKWVMLYREFRSVLADYYHSKMNIPTLAVMGSEDYVFLGASRRYANSNPEYVTLEIMDHCGHICNVEQPDQFNQIVHDHLENKKLISTSLP